MKAIISQFLISVVILGTGVFITSCKREPIELGVRVGNETFSKEVFFADPEIGEVTAIQFTDSASGLLPEILVVGEKGSSLVTLDGEVIDKTIFDSHGGVVKPLFNAESGSYDYLNRGGGWQPISYIDSSGKTVVSISDPTPNDAVLIDVNNDGIQDIVMGSNAGGGLVAFNLKGEKIWKKNTSNSFDVEIFREDEDSRIVHTDGNEILVRTKTGELLRTLQLPFETFKKGSWPGIGKEAIVGMHRDSIIGYSIEGARLGSYPIERTGVSTTTAVLHKNKSPEYFGAIVSLRATSHRSEFYVYEGEDALIYHEVIEAQHPVLEFISGDDTGRYILVGGDKGTVWRYNFK